jgi:hypothetical protein
LWEAEERGSQVVFIGRNLQREDILAGLEECKVRDAAACGV